MSISTLTLTPELLRQIEVRAHPNATKFCLMVADSSALIISVGLSIAFKALLEGGLNIRPYLILWPFLLVFLMAYAALGLYSIVGLSPAEELRRGTLSSVLLFLLLGAATVPIRGAERQFTWALLLSLALSVVLMPLARGCVRRCFAGKSWWGYPAVIFGAGPTGQKILKAIRTDISISLKPVAFIDEQAAEGYVLGVPVFADYAFAQALIPSKLQAYAIFAEGDLPPGDRSVLMDRCHGDFSAMMVVPELHGVSTLWLSSKNVGGMLGLEVGQRAWHETVKHAFDLAFGMVILNGWTLFHRERRIGRSLDGG